ncbi:hypothetical protein PSHT_10712, partial [Puccinia striiformis]
MSHFDHSWDPCPWVVLNDFGGAFAMGAIGGIVWHGVKGMLTGSLAAIKARAPVVGGNFGVWGGMFSSFDCLVKGYRQKEDPWNAILSGFMTGGALAARGGVRSMVGSAIGCGVLLGVFEGVGVLFTRLFAENNRPIAPPPAKQYTMSHSDHSRDPCPWVVLNDFGGAFAMGAIGGTVWHGVKGMRNSPKGDRLTGSLAAIKARAPVVGGNFGVWGGMFSSFDCLVKGYRQKEDPWNAILSGFMTGGALAARGGVCSMVGSAIGCGVLLGVFEGVGVLFTRLFAENNRPIAPPIEPIAAPQTPTNVVTSS